MLGHEKFEAYQIAVQFLTIALKLIENLPRGNAGLKDQFKRAAISVSLNIAEGSGKIQERDRRHFYAIARGSAMECAAICDVIVLLDKRFGEDVTKAKSHLKSIIAILSTICLR